MIPKRYLSLAALLIAVVPWQVTAAFLAVTVGMQVAEFVARLIAAFLSNPEPGGRIERLFDRHRDRTLTSASELHHLSNASWLPTQATGLDGGQRRSDSLLRSGRHGLGQ